jgi:hypothetical protein
MQIVSWIILLTGVYPLWCAWDANRRTSLIQTIHWTIIAWMGWGAAFLTFDRSAGQAVTGTCYVALCLTGCAGIAVLGARRPGLRAWNFVVLALLAVNLLPVAECVLKGGFEVTLFHLLCVATAVAIGIINYLPTSLAPAAALLMLGLGLVVRKVWVYANVQEPPHSLFQMGWFVLACVPWVAFACYARGGEAVSKFDRQWLEFRNRFGLVWGQRVREQFNRSAYHAGWPVTLYWQGLHRGADTTTLDAEVQKEILSTLRALTKRFGPAPT